MALVLTGVPSCQFVKVSETDDTWMTWTWMSLAQNNVLEVSMKPGQRQAGLGCELPRE